MRTLNHPVRRCQHRRLYGRHCCPLGSQVPWVTVPSSSAFTHPPAAASAASRVRNSAATVLSPTAVRYPNVQLDDGAGQGRVDLAAAHDQDQVHQVAVPCRGPTPGPGRSTMAATLSAIWSGKGYNVTSGNAATSAISTIGSSWCRSSPAMSTFPSRGPAGSGPAPPHPAPTAHDEPMTHPGPEPAAVRSKSRLPLPAHCHIASDHDAHRDLPTGHNAVSGTPTEHPHPCPTLVGETMSIGSMLYGAGLSAIVAVVLVGGLARVRRPAVLITAGLAAFLMPLWWNSILRWTGATQAFSHDLPFRPFPVSWQDTGSGMFTLAGAAIALTLSAGTREPARTTTKLASWTALAAFLIDIYTY